MQCSSGVRKGDDEGTNCSFTSSAVPRERSLVNSLRKIFPRLPIRAKLLIAFAGLSVLPVLCVSIYGIWVNVRTMERIALGNLSHDVSMIRGRTMNFLGDAESDLRVLANSTHLEEFLESAQRGNVRREHAALNDAAEEFLAFARTKRIYYQIRVIDTTGDELFRVESDVDSDSAANMRVVPGLTGGQSGGTYYRLLTRGLGRGEIAFAPAELVHGVNQRVPVMSFATPLIGRGGCGGILIANIFAGYLFDALEIGGSLNMGERVVLVGSDGHYLYDSDERGNWNRLLASREEDNLQKDYLPAIAAQILSRDEGVIADGGGDIIAYAPLFPLRPPGSGRREIPGLTATLHVFECVPRSNIAREARLSAMLLGGFLLLFFGGAIGLGLLATGQFTRPISELRRGAEIISRGNYHHRLNVETGDEIEALSRQFNLMAASLEEHEEEIQRHRTQLEDMVKNRTKELVEEKGKLQAILDNVPSAFVMLDRDFRIQTASAAFTTITGLTLETVRGRDSRSVFREAGLCNDHSLTGGPEATRHESHVDRLTEPGGNERFLEHTSIPIHEEGGVGSILQIISDITARKRLEDHLIQSEKLMATGEMAAIIAHGFRNSLTSIKMILQLQQESKKAGAAGRKSAQVALDSIGRMEAVVQELLNFARPSPMQFGLQDLNSLIGQGLALIEPRMKGSGIVCTARLDPHIPPMVLDAAHLREALVNVLLNALQAIEGRPQTGERGKISVTTARFALPKTLRDFRGSEFRYDQPGQPMAEGSEIVLRKGMQCAVVTVADNGPGIERDTLRRIFDPFYTTKTNGTGLGLPMVKRAVNAHGGVVTVRSNRGKGATFEIILPLEYNGSRFGDVSE